MLTFNNKETYINTFLYFQSPNNVVRYMISSTSANRDLFFMEETTGNVYLRTSIIGSGVDQYVVSIFISACDAYISCTLYCMQSVNSEQVHFHGSHVP